MKSLTPDTLELSARVMDLQLQRQNLVMGNLSNINTPGYNPRRLDFEEKLQAALAQDSRGAMARTSPDHMPTPFASEGFKGDLLRDVKPRTVPGEDRVDLDKEMAVMQKNALQYQTLTLVVQRGYAGINKIITDSKA